MCISVKYLFAIISIPRIVDEYFTASCCYMNIKSLRSCDLTLGGDKAI